MAEAQNTGNEARDMRPTRLRDALRQARIEAADRTGVVVELRDAEVARLEILNEALDPLFAAHMPAPLQPILSPCSRSHGRRISTHTPPSMETATTHW